VTEFPCDLCGATDAVEVPHARVFTADQPVHICTTCGFVYVKQRRSSDEIAASWTVDIFGAGYTAAVPGVVGRLAYVAAFVEQSIGLRGKAVAEIGAGEGFFLELARRGYGASVFGIEPSPANCERMRSLGIDCISATIEEYDGSRDDAFDVVMVLWTLENCQDLRALLGGARRLLKPGGHVVIGTGSRILVPFKKPLWAYLSRNPADTHSFRFSANTLRGALAMSGFETVQLNSYLDNDILCVIGRPAEGDLEWPRDDYLEVHGFFERWYADTVMYFPDDQRTDGADRALQTN
jgi:SAM-dependent methyltransferase